MLGPDAWNALGETIRAVLGPENPLAVPLVGMVLAFVIAGLA